MPGVGRNSYKKAMKKAKAKTNKKKPKTPLPMGHAKPRKTGALKTRKLTDAQKKSIEKQKQNNKKNRTGVIRVPSRRPGLTRPKKTTRK